MGAARWGGREGNLYSEPVSPMARVFLQEELDLTIDSFITFQNPIDVSSLKSSLSSSLISKFPRLRSSLIVESEGRCRWQELSSIDVNKQVIIVPEGDGEEKEDEEYMNEYLATLTSLSPLKRDIPLWDVHVLPPRRRSLVVRFHHALGDCVSLLAVLLSSCDMKEVFALPLPRRERISFVRRVWRALKAAKYTINHVREQSMLTARSKKDFWWMPKEGLERLPRKLASLSLSMEDMKMVKNKVDATINDVFVGIISYGIAEYIDTKSSIDNPENAGVMGVVNAINLRKNGSKELLELIKKGKDIKWGNIMGSLVLPIELKKRDNPLEHVTEAKARLDRRKISYAAQYIYMTFPLTFSLVGRKAMNSLSYKFRHNTSMTLSNIVGPTEPITLAGNLVTKIGVTVSLLPAVIDVHMISYNGRAFLQFVVAEEIFPDPELLCACVEEGLEKMKANI